MHADYDIQSDLLDEPLLIFIVATTGQGSEPSNMRSFWRFLLRSDLPSDLIEHLHFTIFGLGDSSYAKFNWPAKKLYRRLITLGAEEFYEKGEADDQDYLGRVLRNACYLTLILRQHRHNSRQVASGAVDVFTRLVPYISASGYHTINCTSAAATKDYASSRIKCRSRHERQSKGKSPAYRYSPCDSDKKQQSHTA